MRRAARVGLVVLLAAVPSVLLAYGTVIHNLLPGRALGGLRAPSGRVVDADTLPGAADRDLDAFRALLYARASRLADTATRHAFLRRYPDAAAFSPRALKEFLMMDGGATVLGVDSFAAVYRAMPAKDRRLDPHPDYVSGQRLPLVTALELGSIYPDLDRRNQSRLVRDAAGRPVLTAAGDSIPFDPVSLNMGRLTGLSSQAHAHYGLNRHPKSSDPAVLKQAPWDFAIATGYDGPVETFAPDNAQLYSDLSLIALLDGRPGLRTLSALYAGNAMHYVADVGNAVHTVQVGIYPIFVDATIQAWLRKAFTLFGLFGRAPSRNAIGVDIITNLHTLSEELFQEELSEGLRAEDAGRLDAERPSVRTAVRALTAGDDSLARVLGDTLSALDRTEVAPAFGRLIAQTVVDASFRDGAEVYRVTREIAVRPLRTGRVTVDFDTVPNEQVWRFVRVVRAAPEHSPLDDFNAVHARGIARTATALRRWWEQYNRAASLAPARRRAALDTVVSRLVRERLAYLDEAEARRLAWMHNHAGGPAAPQ